MKKFLLTLVAVVIVSSALGAETDTVKPKIKTNLIGRVLMDADLYVSNNKDRFHNGVGIPEIRLGAVMNYGHWTGKVEMGFTNYKVCLKDLYIQYTPAENVYYRVGSFIQPFGLQAPTSSSLKSTFQDPLPNVIFNPGRQLGAMAHYHNRHYIGAATLHTGVEAMKESPNQAGGQGFGLSTRQVVRYASAPGKVVQTGVSAGINFPNGRHEKSNFKFKGNFPGCVNQVPLVADTVRNALNQFRISPELLLCYSRVALEAEYFYSRVNMREQLKCLDGYGVDVAVRGMIMGKGYSYNYTEGAIATCAPGSLELVLGYAYTCLSDADAQQYNAQGNVVTGIYGGRANQASATLSYYINKYICARLNYTYTYAWDSAIGKPCDQSVFRARFQVIF